MSPQSKRQYRSRPIRAYPYLEDMRLPEMEGSMDNNANKLSHTIAGKRMAAVWASKRLALAPIFPCASREDLQAVYWPQECL